MSSSGSLPMHRWFVTERTDQNRTQQGRRSVAGHINGEAACLRINHLLSGTRLAIYLGSQHGGRRRCPSRVPPGVSCSAASKTTKPQQTSPSISLPTKKQRQPSSRHPPHVPAKAAKARRPPHLPVQAAAMACRSLHIPVQASPFGSCASDDRYLAVFTFLSRWRLAVVAPRSCFNGDPSSADGDLSSPAPRSCLCDWPAAASHSVSTAVISHSCFNGDRPQKIT
ncbi:uncharacterized protein LOC133490926 [Syngnathoides biaculeatus]|uniref:uncharacterized protein LOC133490926 n=1 Tax=Syngnathoides biaculeatus TaxID=300417 RepID=UPI002ADD5E51|nr:uncharacterized protein LOC133490926 [Syngnathoides biaculeatus]